VLKIKKTNNRLRNKEYSEYLESRSLLGILYKLFFIYPKFFKYFGANNLDYGCGIGDLLYFSKLFNKKLLGVDPNKFNISVCKNRGLNANYLSNNFFNSSKKEIYDCIVMDNVLEHISKPEKTLKIINQILKKKAFLIIGVPVGKVGFLADPDHKIYYDEKSLDQKLNKYSLSKESFFYVPFNLKFFRDQSKMFCFYAIYKKDAKC